MSGIAAGDGGSVRGPAARCLLFALLLTCIAASLALSALVLRESMVLRTFEAWLSGNIVPSLTGIKSGPVPRSPIVWFANGPHRYLAMFVSSECTVDPLIVPFLMGTVCVAWRQAAVVRPLIALAIAIALLLSMNQLRLLVIIVLTVRFGEQAGFYWGHTFTGSLITIFGVAFTFLTYVLIVVWWKRHPRHRRSRRDSVNQSALPPG